MPLWLWILVLIYRKDQGFSNWCSGAPKSPQDGAEKYKEIFFFSIVKQKKNNNKCVKTVNQLKKNTLPIHYWLSLLNQITKTIYSHCPK